MHKIILTNTCMEHQQYSLNGKLLKSWKTYEYNQEDFIKLLYQLNNKKFTLENLRNRYAL